MKKFKSALLFIILTGFLAIQGFAQFDTGEPYYVSAEKATLFDSTSTSVPAIKTLDKYDNLILLDTLRVQWTQVKIANTQTIGYVKAPKIDRGKAIRHSSRYRTGAVCEDGSRSSATGRGACSWHGGVSYWTHNTRVWYTIDKDD